MAARVFFMVGMMALAGCQSRSGDPVAAVPSVTENVTVAGQTYPLRYTPTGDSVPHMGVGVVYVNDDGTTVQEPDVTVYEIVTYPTVRVGGTTDEFRALDVWFARCAPGETYNPKEYGDEVFTLDAKTAEFVFTYPCPPLAELVAAAN